MKNGRYSDAQIMALDLSRFDAAPLIAFTCGVKHQSPEPHHGRPLYDSPITPGIV